MNTNPISNTAFYCCGVRVDDAARRNSVCNDQLAKRFMDARGKEIFEPFRSEKMPNISNVVRHRIIDDYLRAALSENPDATVVIIGAGFDTRAFRLPGGRWIELDEPQIIAYKNERLPVAESKNPVQRIAIDFSSESLSEKLSGIDTADSRVVIVIEGVIFYLDEAAVLKTLAELQSLFKQHVIICDLMTRRFFEKFARSIHEKIQAVGARFTDRPEAPEKIFQGNRYRALEHTPISQRATELGVYKDLIGIPTFISRLMGFLMKDLRGYAIWVFEYRGS